VLRRDLLDVHSALGGDHHQRALGDGIVEHGDIELARDRDLLVHEHALDRVPADLQAEHARCGLTRLLGRGDERNAAGLSALARRHLRLHDRAPAERPRRVRCLLRRAREPPARDRDPSRRQERLCRVFLEIHGFRTIVIPGRAAGAGPEPTRCTQSWVSTPAARPFGSGSRFASPGMTA
jgi:hypothetical protein